MKKATVVIGSSFGDEGKGLMTDYLVRSKKIGLVARFNGGAQAGHTVQVDNTRHVFGHLGAGSFAGADTYFSSDFIVNPIAFKQEYKKYCEAERKILKDKFPILWQYVNPNCRVSTIYDMCINSLIELHRGSSAHGSCGMGINETVTRSEFAEYKIVAADFNDLKNLSKIVKLIKTEWVPKRLEALGLSSDFNQWNANPAFHVPELKMIQSMLNILNNSLPGKVAEDLIEDSQMFYLGVPKLQGDEFVFEGAQGLMLDEELGIFPHVTRSLTGLPNAIRAAQELGVNELNPLYIMRAYTTRHGNGPLEHEQDMNLPQDLTNQPNQWQGTLRFAPLNLKEISKFIKADLDRTKNSLVKINEPELAVSCLDQAESFKVITVKGIVEVSAKDLPLFIERELGYKVRYTSHGPTAETVVQY